MPIMHTSVELREGHHSYKKIIVTANVNILQKTCLGRMIPSCHHNLMKTRPFYIHSDLLRLNPDDITL